MQKPWYRWQGNDLLLNVFVQPRSSQNAVVGVHDNALKVRLTAPPVDGKANVALCEFLAQLCGVSRSRVTLESGPGQRHKIVRISLDKPVLPADLSNF